MKAEEQKYLVEQIKSKYINEPHTYIEKMRELDKNVSRPANIFAYAFGIIGCLVFGAGMSLAMKVIGDNMLAGIVVGLTGIFMMCINYPVYKVILRARKLRYGDEIIRLGNRILENLGEN